MQISEDHFVSANDVYGRSTAHFSVMQIRGTKLVRLDYYSGGYWNEKDIPDLVDEISEEYRIKPEKIVFIKQCFKIENTGNYYKSPEYKMLLDKKAEAKRKAKEDKKCRKEKMLSDIKKKLSDEEKRLLKLK